MNDLEKICLLPLMLIFVFFKAQEKPKESVHIFY